MTVCKQTIIIIYKSEKVGLNRLLQWYIENKFIIIITTIIIERWKINEI